jgi:hypothetical protein
MERTEGVLVCVLSVAAMRIDCSTFSAEAIAGEFSLGEVVECEPLALGNAPSYRLQTTSSIYFLKGEEREDDLRLYKQVEEQLNAVGVKQAHLESRPDGDLTSSKGYAVYEFLEGSPRKQVSNDQFEATLIYLVPYFEALRQIQPPPYLSELRNVWTKADSLEFLTIEILPNLNSLSISERVRETSTLALEFLAERKKDLESVDSQLIHGDIGPGNILFDGNEVVAVIDFSPHVGNTLYALCHFFYWQCFIYDGWRINHERIAKGLRCFVDNDIRVELLHPFFVKAAAFRLFGPLMANLEGENSYSEKQIERRADGLLKVLWDEKLQMIHANL